ncbi:surface lipoprotein assembly modifier [Sphingomonas yunnanensis]|uniref:surface lipoprotein assembly modifier n=1 Tax=Sphingomonas yunnanensis TaxID=310400 RepID=UPI001CA6B1B1|nr:surface lipoprotein assembly modifier [Sphingomonas yunnanensis]MBY9064266.1 surface lipoprotein assembly modifier [Sphingomonas yunnanensis]
MTPTQLLGAAERLVTEGRYAEAKPLVDVLRQAPELRFQSAFLHGLIASRTGDYATAADQFMAILANDPRQTRVRLELAQAFMALKKTASADRQLRIAQQDADLPQQVARTIRIARDTIRSGRAWRLDINLGLAPDTNINNATSARSVTILLGDDAYSADLSKDAKATSGLGATAQLSTGLRLPISDKISALVEIDANGTDYSGKRFDDFSVQSAAGAEYRVTATRSVSLEGTYARRWFGGRSIIQQYGARIGSQMTLGRADRLGLQIDLRRNRAFYDSGYDGWQGGVYATFEHALTRTIVASIGPFVRREWLHEDAFSNREFGGNVGIGGELPRGFNVGASVGVSRAIYDAALPLFDPKPRLDNRAVFRATVGNRMLRLHGFSPQVNWTHNRIDSSLGLYSITRSRWEVTLARYF